MGEYDVIVERVEQVGNLSYERGLLNPIIVTDENVARFHAESVLTSLRHAGFTPQVITIPAGENYKNLETIQKLWHGFLEHGLDRKSTVIALGGGVIGDMTGFAAQRTCPGSAGLYADDPALDGRCLVGRQDRLRPARRQKPDRRVLSAEACAG
jgi:3-dehydroquinate synthetase